MPGASKEEYRAAPTRPGNCCDWVKLRPVKAEGVPHDPSILGFSARRLNEVLRRNPGSGYPSPPPSSSRPLAWSICKTHRGLCLFAESPNGDSEYQRSLHSLDSLAGISPNL